MYLLIINKFTLGSAWSEWVYPAIALCMYRFICLYIWHVFTYFVATLL